MIISSTQLLVHLQLTLAVVAATDTSSVSTPTFIGFSYCVAYQSCWPSSLQFSQLNSLLVGRVIYPTPFAAPCHNNTGFNSTLCSQRQNTTASSEVRVDIAGAYLDTYWENGNGTCFLDTNRSQACEQGLVPVVGVDAQQSSDIVNAVKFAAQHRLRLRIKNSGHDLLGRSSGDGSFVIWMHNYKGIQFLKSFTPSGGGGKGVPAVTINAGEALEGVFPLLF
jgi:hypothetical protein